MTIVGCSKLCGTPSYALLAYTGCWALGHVSLQVETWVSAMSSHDIDQCWEKAVAASAGGPVAHHLKLRGVSKAGGKLVRMQPL
jgi:hypothetical protein